MRQVSKAGSHSDIHGMPHRIEKIFFPFVLPSLLPVVLGV